MVTPLTGAVVAAVILFVAGVLLLCDYRGVVRWLSVRSGVPDTWYTTPAGLRWEGAVMVSVSLVLGGVMLVGASLSAPRAIGAVLVGVGLVSAIALITYGTAAYSRHGRTL